MGLACEILPTLGGEITRIRDKQKLPGGKAMAPRHDAPLSLPSTLSIPQCNSLILPISTKSILCWSLGLCPGVRDFVPDLILHPGQHNLKK